MTRQATFCVVFLVLLTMPNIVRLNSPRPPRTHKQLILNCMTDTLAMCMTCTNKYNTITLLYCLRKASKAPACRLSAAAVSKDLMTMLIVLALLSTELMSRIQILYSWRYHLNMFRDPQPADWDLAKNLFAPKL